MTQAERRKLLERQKTLRIRKRISGTKFPSSAQSELDKINKKLTTKSVGSRLLPAGRSLIKLRPPEDTVARTKATQANNAKKLSELEKQIRRLESIRGVGKPAAQRKLKKLKPKLKQFSRKPPKKRSAAELELIPKGATGPQPRGSEMPSQKVGLTPPAPKVRPKVKPKPPVRARKQPPPPPQPRMMFDAKSQQTTPDVGAMAQGVSKVKKAMKKSIGGGRGKMAGNKGFETMKEYFADDMSQRKSRVKTPLGIITIDSSDEGMDLNPDKFIDTKYGGKVMSKVKKRKGKRAALRGRRAEMKGS